MIYKNLRNYFSAIFSLMIFAALLSVNPLQTLAAGGGLDPTFSGNGKLATDFGGAADKANAVAVQSDGKIVVVGQSGNSTMAIARYNADGTLDTTFSSDGRVTETSGGLNSTFNAVTIQSDGKILAAGTVGGVAAGSVTMYRYNSNGTPDTTFSGDGNTTFPEFQDGVIYAMAIQNDGKIVAVGRRFNSIGFDWMVARYRSDGILDFGNFGGNNGFVATDFGGNSLEVAHSVVILSNGRILVGGVANPGGQDFALALYTTNGSLDTNFDGDGKVTTDFGNGNDQINSIKVQPDGKIIAAGSAMSAGNTNFALARYNANGSLDTSFDADGKVETNINSSGNDSANELALQSDGRIVAVGDNGNLDFTLARYNSNGSLDTSFGTAGLVFTDIFSNDPDTANAVAIQPDGRIVVAGTAQNNANPTDFAVARYLPNSGNSPFDFDGDSKTDIGIFRPSNGQWWINRSSDSSTFATAFGLSNDKIMPADFTGDGKADIAFFRPSNGQWFVLRSEDSTFYAFPFGANGDTPVTGDYDGDGKADAGVFRPSNLTWYISKSSGGTDIIGFGAANDKPVIGDYDGDGRSDIAIFRNGATGAEWWIRRSSDATVFALQFGISTDKPVQGDFTGDGKADIAFFRPSNGNWFILRSEDLSFYSFPFGAANDVPAAGDYDGDGRFDAGVFRPSNTTWYVNRSTAGTLIQQFGQTGDKPLPNAFVP